MMDKTVNDFAAVAAARIAEHANRLIKTGQACNSVSGIADIIRQAYHDLMIEPSRKYVTTEYQREQQVQELVEAAQVALRVIETDANSQAQGTAERLLTAALVPFRQEVEP